jgi:hypothetical protein
MRTYSSVKVKHFLARPAVHTHATRAISSSSACHSFARRARCGDVTSCATLACVHALDDGTYDAFIVWAETRDNDRVTLDITITAGVHSGDVVSVVARAFRHDPVALVGLPCTLVVRDGVPRVELDA